MTGEEIKIVWRFFYKNQKVQVLIVGVYDFQIIEGKVSSTIKIKKENVTDPGTHVTTFDSHYHL